MKYNLNGKTINVPDAEVNAFVAKYNLTEDEAIQLWLEDNDYLENEVVNELVEKGKALRHYEKSTKERKSSTKERKVFFSDNHLSGDVSASFALGLKDKNTLVACISFRKHKEGIEIARYACLSDFVIVGGFSRLLKNSYIFLKELYPSCTKLISYCDRDITPDYKDSVYFKNGFTFFSSLTNSFILPT